MGSLRVLCALFIIGTVSTSVGALAVTTPGTVIENHTFMTTVTIRAEDVTIRNCEFRGCKLVLENAHRARIENNRWHDVWDDCLSAWREGTLSNDVVVRNNRFERVGMGIVMNGTGWTVEGNTIVELVDKKGDSDYMRVGGHNHVFRRNLLYGTRDGDVGGAHVDGFQNFGAPFTDSIFEENIIMSYDQGIFIKAPDTGDPRNHRGITIRNNVFVGTFADGVPGGGWGYSGKDNGEIVWSDIVVDNNTFIDHWNVGVGTSDDFGEVTDNIFVNVKNPLGAPPRNMFIDRNLFWPELDDEAGPNGIKADPELQNINDILGPDGQPFTADDGWRATAAVAAGKGAQIPVLSAKSSLTSDSD